MQRITVKQYYGAIMTTDNNLPEGVLRSTFLPEDTLNGTKLFLSYENGWYLVHTRWQILARRRNLDKAASLYESIIMGDVDFIGGCVCTKRPPKPPIDREALLALGSRERMRKAEEKIIHDRRVF